MNLPRSILITVKTSGSNETVVAVGARELVVTEKIADGMEKVLAAKFEALKALGSPKSEHQTASWAAHPSPHPYLVFPHIVAASLLAAL